MRSGYRFFQPLFRVLFGFALIATPATSHAWAGQSLALLEDGEERPEPPRRPTDPVALKIFKAASAAPGAKILVSIDQRRLWLMNGKDTVVSRAIAVGMNKDFSFDGKNFRFETPRGKRKILRKEANPYWIPPDWHYYEKAVLMDLTPVPLKENDLVELSDGSRIEVVDNIIYFVNRFNAPPHEWSAGKEIIFDGMIFIPPMESPQRRIPEALGPRKLDMGDGYMIHGTHLYNEDSIGLAVSHGCVRMKNEDVMLLYDKVKVGTPVYIF
jgi:hypothetical protein